jgi:hypothetical protein
MAYLKPVSVTVASAFLLGLLFVAVAMLVTQGEHVAFERANQRCESSAPPGVTGWTLDWNPDAETFTCIYDRNGRRTGRRLRITRGDL